jgi:hypothetical protein
MLWSTKYDTRPTSVAQFHTPSTGAPKAMASAQTFTSSALLSAQASSALLSFLPCSKQLLRAKHVMNWRLSAIHHYL